MLEEEPRRLGPGGGRRPSWRFQPPTAPVGVDLEHGAIYVRGTSRPGMGPSSLYQPGEWGGKTIGSFPCAADWGLVDPGGRAGLGGRGTRRSRVRGRTTGPPQSPAKAAACCWGRLSAAGRARLIARETPALRPPGGRPDMKPALWAGRGSGWEGLSGRNEAKAGVLARLGRVFLRTPAGSQKPPDSRDFGQGRDHRRAHGRRRPLPSADAWAVFTQAEVGLSGQGAFKRLSFFVPARDLRFFAPKGRCCAGERFLRTLDQIKPPHTDRPLRRSGWIVGYTIKAHFIRDFPASLGTMTRPPIRTSARGSLRAPQRERTRVVRRVIAGLHGTRRRWDGSVFLQFASSTKHVVRTETLG